MIRAKATMKIGHLVSLDACLDYFGLIELSHMCQQHFKELGIGFAAGSSHDVLDPRIHHSWRTEPSQ